MKAFREKESTSPYVKKSTGGRPPKPFSELGKKRKAQLLEEIKKVVGDRAQELFLGLKQNQSPGKSDLEKQLLSNIKDFFEVCSPPFRGIPAAILTKDLPLKEASSATGVSKSVISVARSQVRKGIFRVIKVSFLFLDEKRRSNEETNQQQKQRQRATIPQLSLPRRRRK